MPRSARGIFCMAEAKWRRTFSTSPGSKPTVNWCWSRPGNTRNTPALSAPGDAERRQSVSLLALLLNPRRRIALQAAAARIPGSILIDTARPDIQHEPIAVESGRLCWRGAPCWSSLDWSVIRNEGNGMASAVRRESCRRRTNSISDMGSRTQKLSLAIEGREPLPMTACSGGWFEIVGIAAPGPVSLSATERHGRSRSGLARAKQRRARSEHRRGSGSYKWRNELWRGRPWEEAVLYELHVGILGGFAESLANCHGSPTWASRQSN